MNESGEYCRDCWSDRQVCGACAEVKLRALAARWRELSASLSDDDGSGAARIVYLECANDLDELVNKLD